MSRWLPKTEAGARSLLAALWIAMFAINVLGVLVLAVGGAFGPLSEAKSQQEFRNALQSLFYIFAPNISVILAYWYALSGTRRNIRLKNEGAFVLATAMSLLWGVILTTVHFVFSGSTTYTESLPAIADISNWLVVGVFGYYFGAEQRAAPVPQPGAPQP